MSTGPAGPPRPCRAGGRSPTAGRVAEKTTPPRRSDVRIGKAFGVRAGHSLRLVRAAPRGDEAWEWEHEERDRDGRLVAVYESWSPRGDAPPIAGQGGGGGFVKDSPHGWVLRRSEAEARRRTRAGGVETPPLAHGPPSVRLGMAR